MKKIKTGIVPDKPTLEQSQELSATHDKALIKKEVPTTVGTHISRASESMREVFDVREAADYLRVSESIIRRLLRERRIPFFQIEGRYLFFRPSLDNWIIDRIVPATGTSAKESASTTANEIWDGMRGRN